MAKITAVVLCNNIYLPTPDGKAKYIRGDQVEMDRVYGEDIVAQDKKAGREPRLTLVIRKPKRGTKNAD